MKNQPKEKQLKCKTKKWYSMQILYGIMFQTCFVTVMLDVDGASKTLTKITLIMFAIIGFGNFIQELRESK